MSGLNVELLAVDDVAVVAEPPAAFDADDADAASPLMSLASALPLLFCSVFSSLYNHGPNNHVEISQSCTTVYRRRVGRISCVARCTKCMYRHLSDVRILKRHVVLSDQADSIS